MNTLCIIIFVLMTEPEEGFMIPPIIEDSYQIILDENNNLGSVAINQLDLTLTVGDKNAR